MAYFLHGGSRNRLSVLYVCNSLGIELTRNQMVDAMVSNDWIGYFDTECTIGELEEDGYIAAVPREFGQVYMLTDRAHEALSMFSHQLIQSFRNEMDEYAKLNRDRLLRANQYHTDIKSLSEGVYLVKLLIVEQERVLLKLEALAPDYASARRACDAWQSKCDSVYSNVLQNLFAIPKAASGSDDLTQTETARTEQ